MTALELLYMILDETFKANSHMPCHAHAALMLRCAVALRNRFQKSMVVALHGCGNACVNQMGKTQSKPLAVGHGRGQYGRGMGTAWYV
jgi:hypothetical protein